MINRKKEKEIISVWQNIYLSSYFRLVAKL